MSSRRPPPALSTHHNQPRMPFSTPTSRKVAAGPARRGFPRAGGRGVGAGRKRSRTSRRSNVARRRAKGAQRARSTTPTRACSRRGRRPRPRGRGRMPAAAGGHGSGARWDRALAEESCQRVFLVRPPQLVEGPTLDLPYPFPGEVHDLTNLPQGLRLVVNQPEAKF